MDVLCRMFPMKLIMGSQKSILKKIWVTSFHSPKEGGGAWNPDFEYEDWQWILARTSDSGWELLQWGY